MIKLAKDLEMPIAAVTQTFAFLGKRGGGKTYAASKLGEQMLGIGAQIIVLDVVGTWYGLRVPKNPKGKAFDILVFGGLNGDIEINPKAGKIVASIILEKNLSAVVDISQFIHSEQTRFAYDFLITLFEGRKANPGACHVFLEEAQELVPQNLPAGSDNFAGKMLHAGERLVKLGRNFGIGCSLISQRPQEVNKKVLNQTEVLLAFQMTGLQERKTIRDWVRDKGDETDVEQQLPRLEIGQALIWSPTWLKISGTYKIGEKITADVSATPEVGATVTRENTLAKVDVTELQKSIGELTAELEANTPAALKKTIAERDAQIFAMKRELENAGKPIVTTTEKEIEVPVPVLDEAKLNELSELIQNWMQEIAGITVEFKEAFDVLHLTRTGHVTKLLADLRNAQPKLPSGLKTAVPPQTRPQPVQKPIESRPQSGIVPDRTAISAHGHHLPEGERKILIVIAQYSDRGGASRELISILTGYARSSRNTYISRLSTKDYVEGGSNNLFVTADGLAALGDYESMPEGQELQHWWLSRLPEGEAKILDIIIKAYPSAVDRDRISDATGYARSSRNTYISRLSTKRLVWSSSDGVTASSDLF